MFESSHHITLLCESDFKILNALDWKIDPRDRLFRERQAKLKHAIVLEDHLYPVYLVRTGAVVSLKDLGTGSISRFRLTGGSVVPNDFANASSDIPATSALGATLLGMQVGEDIMWTLPLGHIRYLRICRLTAPENFKP